MYRTRSVLAVSTARRRPGQVAFASPHLRNVGMRILAFDGRMGAGGDMILATLLAGAIYRRPRARDRRPGGGVSDRQRRRPGGIAATTVDVLLTGEEESGRRRTRPRSPPRHRSPPTTRAIRVTTRPRRHSRRGVTAPPQLSRGPRDCRRDGPRAAGRTRRARDLRDCSARGGGESVHGEALRGDSLPRWGRRRDRGRGQCRGLASSTLSRTGRHHPLFATGGGRFR